MQNNMKWTIEFFIIFLNEIQEEFFHTTNTKANIYGVFFSKENIKMI